MTASIHTRVVHRLEGWRTRGARTGAKIADVVSQLSTIAESIERLANFQAGMISRRQLLAAGLSASQARAELNAHRWATVFPGVYAVRTGSITPMGLLWAAILYAGEGAVASGLTALWLADTRRTAEPPRPVEIAVPAARRVVAQPGLIVVRRSCAPEQIHDWPPPARVRPEIALLDVAAVSAGPAAVADLVLRCLQRRVTTPAKISAALAGRGRQRWRPLLESLLAEVADGVQSPLELLYVSDVQRAHGLPDGVCNHRDQDRDGRVRFRDVIYALYRVIVELDGREFHPADRAFRDRDRDNGASVRGLTTLRYGWREVAGDSCGVARQVSDVLRQRGWTGVPRACSANCRVDGRSVQAW